MGQRAPTKGQIGVAVAFAFSCFGLLLFLWTAFGGPVPFAPQGYRVQVPVEEATQLAVESDVRIANVSVGRVKAIDLEDEGENRDLALATIELDERYAPIPEDTRAILRSKTLLGETYIELTQGDKDGPTVPEGGMLPAAQVGESVQLDEIFRTFDERTRVGFQTWMQQAALATAGRGADISAAIGNLEPFAEDANRILRTLDTQEGAVKQFVNNTGVVFEALSERQGQLRGLITNSSEVFATTARRDEDLRELFIALPTFLDESRATLTRLDEFAANADPLVDQLHPAARELSAVLKETAKVAPDFNGFFAGMRKVAKRGVTALPAVQTLLDSDLPPLLDQFTTFMPDVTAIVTTLQRYDEEITGFLGNVTGATQATSPVPENNSQPLHYLRSSAVLSPDALSVYPTNRLTTNRSNPYVEPGGALKVASGLESFPIDACPGGTRVTSQLLATTPTDPVFINRFPPPIDPNELFTRIQRYAFNQQLTSAGTAAPPCVNQGPQSAIGSIPELTNYLHVREVP
jgi:phospholipid/cholesterol/gamma-HCH transport system substrate-binding protein